MEFRWVGLIALWTILSGPIFGASNGSPNAAPKAKIVKPIVVGRTAPR
jgi:hypothetical protein